MNRTQMVTMGPRIDELFAAVVEVSIDILSESTTPRDVQQWDSFKHMVLIAAFEEEFDISIEPEDVVEMYKDYETFKSAILRKLG